MEYKYELLDENWDIHWLKSRIFHELKISRWQDINITFIYPIAIIELDPLSIEQKQQLDEIMLKKDISYKAEDIKETWEGSITPESFIDLIEKTCGKKPLYYCVNGKMKLCFFEKTDEQESNKLQKVLGEIWKKI